LEVEVSPPAFPDFGGRWLVRRKKKLMGVAEQASPNPKKHASRVPLPAKLVVGAIAGIIGTTCIFPLDMVKTRLQNQKIGPNGERLYRGAFDCFRKMIAHEGIRGLYRGLVPNLLGVTPEKAIKLAVNETLREALEEEDGRIALPHEILAGGGAGLCQVIATNPMEIVKIRMQVQGTLPPEKRKPAAQVVKELGIRGLYKGTPVTLLRDVPFSVLFFPAYANLRAFFSDADGNIGIAPGFLSGAVAGAMAAGLVTPADVVKTRVQVQDSRYTSIPQCATTVWKEEGFSAFWKGVVPRMAVQAPMFGIALLAFELQKKFILAHQSSA